MPTYDYECCKCGIVFEHYQSIKDEPLKTCIHPEGCKHPDAKAEVKRQIGIGGGLIFKGSGFYSTDYRSKEYKEAAKRESSSSSTSSSSPPPSNGNGSSSTPAASSSSTTPSAKKD